MQIMDFLALISALVSGVVAGAVAIGAMRGQISSLRHELNHVREQAEREASECRQRIDNVIRDLVSQKTRL